MFYRSIVAFDHAKQVIKIVSLDIAETEGGHPAGSGGAGDKRSSTNSRIKALLEAPASNWPPADAGGSDHATTSNWSRPNFEDSRSHEIKELINAGECYQAVLSQCFTRETHGVAGGDLSSIAIAESFAVYVPAAIWDEDDRRSFTRDAGRMRRTSGSNIGRSPARGREERPLPKMRHLPTKCGATRRRSRSI